MSLSRIRDFVRPRSMVAFVATLALWGATALVPSQAPSSGAYSVLDAVFVPQAAATTCTNNYRCETPGGGGPMSCTPASGWRCEISAGAWCDEAEMPCGM